MLHVLLLPNDLPDVVALREIHDPGMGCDLRLHHDGTHGVARALQRQPRGGAGHEGVIDVLEVPPVAAVRGESVDRDHQVAWLDALRGGVALRVHLEDVAGVADDPQVPAVAHIGRAGRRDEERMRIVQHTERGGDVQEVPQSR